MKRLTCGLLGVVATMLCTSPARGQNAGTIQGRVTDKHTGEPLAGITVSLYGSRTATTNHDGRYTLVDAPAGTDTVRFRWIGYAPQEKVVTVSGGGALTLDIALEPVAIQLADVRVTAASRYPERIVEAPAAVTSVEGAHLKEMSVTGQTPLLVADLPGVYAPQSGIGDFNLNARGFNSLLNRRVLVLIDGRDVATPLLGNQDWPGVSVVEDASKVEFVRGPGSALYGANAFNGVLAITSPRVAEALGTRVSVGGGDPAALRVDARHAQLFSNGHAGFRVSAGRSQSDSWDKSRTNIGDLTREYIGAGRDSASITLPSPNYFELTPLNGQTRESAYGTPGPVTGTPDPVINTYGAVRLDWYRSPQSVFTAEGGTTRMENFIVTTQGTRSQITRADRPWARVAWDRHDLSVFAYYMGRTGNQFSLGSGAPGNETSGTLHLEAQGHRRFAGDRGTVVVGGSARRTTIDSRGTVLAKEFDGRSDSYYALFEMAEYALTPKLKAVFASRVDASSLIQTQFSPKLGLVYNPVANQSLRLTANRAFLSPSALQLFLQFPIAAPIDLTQLEQGLRASPLGPALQGVPNGTLFTNSAAVPVLGIGNEHLKPERITNVELGYKGQLRRVYVTADAYYGSLKDFGSGFAPGINPDLGPWTAPSAIDASVRGAVADAANGAVGPGLTRLKDGSTAYVLSVVNAGKAHEWGLELGAMFWIGTRLNVSANYSFSGVDIDNATFVKGDTLLSNTPKHIGNIAATYQWGNGLRIRGGVRATDAFRWRSFPFDGAVPSTQSVDFDASYPITSQLSATLAATNILDQRRYQMYGGSVVGRRVLGMITWQR
ncbi:MAG TPA: TonB-dependent receptor [Gemmatimonadaceae bacterium]|nr:TonB-dependent receptor [Gemmatimonadaceae bacterium]